MKGYKIIWKDIRYGESFIEANSIDDAHKKAKKGEDQDFEELDPSGDWEISEILEIE